MKKYVVLVAGIIFNMVSGVLYSWSIIQSSLINDLEWSMIEATLPYTLAIVCFTIGSLIGGRMQDIVGPRKISLIGGLLTGSGMVISSFILNSNPLVVAIVFGVITGFGIGMGYSSVSPACLKWFSPAKKGMITGIVVGAVGLGAFIYSPLTKTLISNFSVNQTFLILGLGVAFINTICSTFIVNPDTNVKKVTSENNVNWREMLNTKSFYLIFLILALGSSVGLMIIGNITIIYDNQVSGQVIIGSTLIVALLSAFNAGGRIVAGAISDKVGRINLLIVATVLQVVAMLIFSRATTELTVTIAALLTGIVYGTYFSIIPALCADKYGLKNFGTNYGIVYLAWGLAGTLAPLLAAGVGIQVTYYICIVFAFLVFISVIFLKKA